MKALRRDVAVAAFASGAVEMATRVLTFILSIATARVLQPDEVGVLGLAVIIVGVASVVTACAETGGVVAGSLGTEAQYAWAATLTRGTITVCLLTVAPFLLPSLAHLLAGKEAATADLMALVHVLLWQLGLELTATYPRVFLQRRLNLIPLVGANLLQITAHVGLSLLLLWNGYGAMGVASSSVISGGLSSAFLWCRLLAEPEGRWGRRLDAAVWSQTWASTVRVFAGSFAGYLNGRFNSVLVAAVLGPTAMSFYGMAWSMSRVPAWILGQALTLVLVPTLARARSDTVRVERVLDESIRHAYVLLPPACALLFVTAESMVIVVLGAKWLPVLPVLRVMSLSVLMAPLMIASNGLLVATDRGHLTGLATAAQLGTFGILLAPLVSHWGVVGAAIGDVASTTVVTVVLLVLCRFRVPDVRWNIAPAFLPVVTAASSGLLATRLSAELSPGVVKIATEACVVLSGYLLLMCLLGAAGRLVELVNLARHIARRPARAVITPSEAGGMVIDVAGRRKDFTAIGSEKS